MLNEFIEKTILILNRSDLHIHRPNHAKMEIGEKPGSKILYMELSDHLSTLKLEDNIIFQIVVFFGLVDAIVDVQHPELEGEKFVVKYVSLPSTNDCEIIFKEVYRILRVIRNASVHSRNAISINNDEIIISYDYNNLHFSKYCLELLFTFVLLVVEDVYPNEYKMGIFRSLYDDIINQITAFNDKKDLTGRLLTIQNGLRLKRTTRYKVLNPVWSIKSEKIYIERCILSPVEMQHASCDYHINFNNKFYMVPDEILSTTNEVNIIDIDNWPAF